MLRGVHKRIIEVQDTQNECFERAFLIVKEGFREESAEVLERKAGEFVRRAGTVVLNRRRHRRFLRTAAAVLAVLAASTALGMIFVFFV